MEAKINSRFKLNLTWQTYSLLFLLFILLHSMIVGVTGVVQGLEIKLIWPLMAVAVVVSWLLSHFRVNLWLVVVLSFVVGLGLGLTAIGNLWDEWLQLIKWITYYFVSLFRAILHDSSYPTTGTIIYVLEQLGESLGTLLSRIWSWIKNFPQPSQDVFATGLVWSLGMWFTTIWATWFSHRRNQPLIGSIPIIVLVGLLRSYTHSSGNIMLTTLGATLALMVIVSQTKREQNWNEKSVGFSHIIQRNSTWAAALLSVTLVISASIISSIDFDDLIDRFREPRLSDSGEIDNDNPLGVKQSEQAIGIVNQFKESVVGGLPNTNLVGSGPELSDEVVMHVKLEEVDPETGNYLPINTEATHYFRSITYEFYSHLGWNAYLSKIYGYDQSQALIKRYTTNQHLYHLDLEFIKDVGGVIYTVGDLASVDTDYYVGWRKRDGSGNLVDIFGAWIDDDNYRAYSVAPIYSENELRESEPVYPDWVLDRYLQLPEKVPDRVLSLARELTVSQQTPYDKAVAIERYLRTFPYTLDLPAKPLGADIADYFLFDIKKGYCDYYATTMVVLARAVGIPARFVNGFIGGTYEDENDRYVITADQAHSWVEIYFPEHGWIPFEPTAGRPSIERLDARDETPLETIDIENNSLDATDGPGSLYLYYVTAKRVVGSTLLFAILGIMIWLYVDTRIMRRQDPVKVFAKLYRRLERTSRYLDMEIQETDTPYEFSSALQKRMSEIANLGFLTKYLESASKEIKWLVEQSILAAYSPNPPTVFERHRAIRTWVQLRKQFFVARVIVLFTSLKGSVINYWDRRRKRSMLPVGVEDS
jgi:hypothetical protein